MTRFLPSALLIVSAMVFIWFALTASWAHPEAVGSAYIAKQDNSFCRGDRLDCLKYFDDHEMRVRPISQVAELLDARLRHQFAKAFGPQPFFDTFSALLSGVLGPLLAWKICRRKGLTSEQSAICVAFLVLSVGFLSAHLLMFRPGKHLVILFTLATAYLIPKSFPLAVTSAVLCALSDEAGIIMAFVPFAIFREEARDGFKRHWPLVAIVIILSAVTISVYKLGHIPYRPSDLSQKDLSALSTGEFTKRLALISGLASLILFRSLSVVLTVSAFTALLSYLGGDPDAYASGFYYGSHMAVCYYLAAVQQRKAIPWLAVLMIYAVFTYQQANDRYQAAHGFNQNEWVDIHR